MLHQNEDPFRKAARCQPRQAKLTLRRQGPLRFTLRNADHPTQPPARLATGSLFAFADEFPVTSSVSYRLAFVFSNVVLKSGALVNAAVTRINAFASWRPSTLIFN